MNRSSDFPFRTKKLTEQSQHFLNQQGCPHLHKHSVLAISGILLAMRPSVFIINAVFLGPTLKSGIVGNYAAAASQKKSVISSPEGLNKIVLTSDTVNINYFNNPNSMIFLVSYAVITREMRGSKVKVPALYDIQYSFQKKLQQDNMHRLNIIKLQVQLHKTQWLSLLTFLAHFSN